MGGPIGADPPEAVWLARTPARPLRLAPYLTHLQGDDVTVEPCGWPDRVVARFEADPRLQVVERVPLRSRGCLPSLVQW
jgi:hypothetical protein